MEHGLPVDFSTRFPSFRIEEILSPNQLIMFKIKGVFPYSLKALDKLQEFRNFIDAPLSVNSGARLRRGARSMSEVYEINRVTRGKERGWEYSFHLWCAFDISSPKHSPSQLYDLALEFESGKLGKWGGVGLYETFVHVDDRDSITGNVATWKA